MYLGEGYGSKSMGRLIGGVDFTAEAKVIYKTEFTVTAYNGTVSESGITECTEIC